MYIADLTGERIELEPNDASHLGKGVKPHPSPLKAIRRHCLWCCCEQSNEVKYCGAVNCNSHPLRLGKSVAGLRPLTVIKNHCAECNGTSGHARDCKLESCALHPFRNGKNPNRAGLSGRGAENFKQPRQAEKTPAQASFQTRTTYGAGLYLGSIPRVEFACSAGAKV